MLPIAESLPWAKSKDAELSSFAPKALVAYRVEHALRRAKSFRRAMPFSA